MEDKQVSDLLKECLSRRFPLYRDDHTISARPIVLNRTWVGYRTTKANIPFGTTHFDLNLEGETCYLLDIELQKDSRGKGNGRDLYATIEEFALLVGSPWVQTTPSGWTPAGKTRRDYMRKLGYTDVNEFEVHKRLYS